MEYLRLMWKSKYVVVKTHDKWAAWQTAIAEPPPVVRGNSVVGSLLPFEDGIAGLLDSSS